MDVSGAGRTDGQTAAASEVMQSEASQRDDIMEQ